jgi:SAM-dependent methyltransferase
MGLAVAERNFPDLLGPPNPDYVELVAEAASVAAAAQNARFFLRGCVQDEAGYAWGSSGVSGRAGKFGAILDRLKGAAVVELGCGPGIRTFQRLLRRHPPRYYIGVDHGNDFGERDSGEVLGLGSYAELRTCSRDPVDGVLVRADMLDLLSRLPDSFGSVVLNGIDDRIVESKSPYGHALMHEIGRTTAIGGVVLGAAFEEGLLTELPNHAPVKRDPHLDEIPAYYKSSMYSYVRTE